MRQDQNSFFDDFLKFGADSNNCTNPHFGFQLPNSNVFITGIIFKPDPINPTYTIYGEENGKPKNIILDQKGIVSNGQGTAVLDPTEVKMKEQTGEIFKRFNFQASAVQHPSTFSADVLKTPSFIHSNTAQTPYPLEEGNRVTGIIHDKTSNTYAIYGLNNKQEARNIIIKPDGKIVSGLDGSPNLSRVCQQIKTKIKEIFSHFKFPLPNFLKASTQANASTYPPSQPAHSGTYSPSSQTYPTNYTTHSQQAAFKSQVKITVHNNQQPFVMQINSNQPISIHSISEKGIFMNTTHSSPQSSSAGQKHNPAFPKNAYILSDPQGGDNCATGIYRDTQNPHNYIVKGLNSVGEERSIHIDTKTGKITNGLNGSTELGHVGNQMKGNLDRIFKHFDVPLPDKVLEQYHQYSAFPKNN